MASKKKIGRPKGPAKPITPDILGKVSFMAGMGLSDEAMAAILDVSPDTFARRKVDSPEFAKAYAAERAKVEAAVARTLFNAAQGGNISAAIWIEKTRFGRSEKIRVDAAAVDLDKLTDEQLERVANGEDLAVVLRG